MAARFFVDEKDLALGKALDDRHGNVVFPAILVCPRFRGKPSDQWLRVVGAQAWW